MKISFQRKYKIVLETLFSQGDARTLEVAPTGSSLSRAPKRPAFIVCMITGDMGREEVEGKKDMEGVVVTSQRVESRGGGR